MKILDLGAGEFPYFIRYNIPFNKSDEYYYIDARADFLASAQSRLEKFGYNVLASNMHFTVDDAINLDYANNFFDQIYICNFLSAPFHWTWNINTETVELTTNKGRINRSILKQPNDFDYFYNERRQVINEALRVLKPNGHLFIYTDLIIYGQVSFEAILTELKNSKNLEFKELPKEALRVDELNSLRVKQKQDCFCFLADLLPRSQVCQIIKK